MSAATSSPTGKIMGVPASLLSIAGELRNKIYEEVWPLQKPVFPWNPNERLTPGLLRTSKAVCREAASVFYGKICFKFDGMGPDSIAEFLREIGSTNMSYIRHVQVPFPFSSWAPLIMNSHELAFNVILDLPNLRSLTISRETADEAIDQLNELDNPRQIEDSLDRVKRFFEQASFLEEIILEVYEGTLNGPVEQKIESLGWSVRAAAPILGVFDDWGIDDYDDRESYDSDNYYDYGGDADDYDIDKDSDFWRRMASD